MAKSVKVRLRHASIGFSKHNFEKCVIEEANISFSMNGIKYLKTKMRILIYNLGT